MAPVETHPALFHRGLFDEDSRKYPVFAFLEEYIAWFDDRNHDDARIGDYHTADFQVTTSHSTLVESTPDDHAFNDVVPKFYMDPLADHKQFARTFCAVELSNGYEIFAKMVMYADVAGARIDGEKQKIKDPQGREWDIEIPVFYEAELVKGEGRNEGLKFSRIDFIKDTGLINDKLDARGLKHKRSTS